MNFETIKAGFLSYLTEKQGETETAQAEAYDVSSISIFTYSSEFKNYLAEEYDADVSIFSKSISEIMSMDIVNGKIEDNDENDYTAEILNEALSDESVIDAFDSDKSGDLNEDEINIFLNALTTDESGNISFDTLATTVTDIQEGTYNTELEDAEETEEFEADETTEAEIPEEIEDTEETEIAEETEDAVNTEEYTEETAENTEELSETEEDTIVEPEEATTAAEETETPEIEVSDTDEETSSIGSTGSTGNTSGTSSTGSSGGTSSVGNNTTTGTTTTPSETAVDDSMSLEELEQTRTDKQTELSTAQNELSAVYSGDDSEVQSAQDEYDTAEEEYKNAVENDPALEEYKEEIAENLEEIDNAQTEVDDSTNLVNECENKISDQESTISGLEAQLQGAKSALESYSGTDLTEEQEAAKAQAQAEVDRLENEINSAEKTLGEYEDEKKAAEKSLSDAEERLKAAEERKTELDKIVEETASEETKSALEAYNNAKDNLASVKETRASEVQKTIDSLQSEISELDTQINEMKEKETENEFSNSSIEMDVDIEENLTDSQKAELEQIKEIYKENQETYEDIAAQVLEDTGISIPAEAICAIHYRESSCNFNTYLHNGQTLGQTTTIEPTGIYFDNFRDAAVDAIEGNISNYTAACSKYGVENTDCSAMSGVLMFCESYNGTGYRDHGCASAYVYSGTTTYTGGMYVSDHNFSTTTYDSRCGTAVIIKNLMEM